MFLAHFWSIFPILEAKKLFLENLAVTRKFIWVCRKRPDRRKNGKMEGWTDRPYLIGPFQLPRGVQKKTCYIHHTNHSTITTLSPGHYFAIRRKQKRAPGARQTHD